MSLSSTRSTTHMFIPPVDVINGPKHPEQRVTTCDHYVNHWVSR